MDLSPNQYVAPTLIRESGNSASTQMPRQFRTSNASFRFLQHHLRRLNNNSRPPRNRSIDDTFYNFAPIQLRLSWMLPTGLHHQRRLWQWFPLVLCRASTDLGTNRSKIAPNSRPVAAAPNRNTADPTDGYGRDITKSVFGNKPYRWDATSEQGGCRHRHEESHSATWPVNEQCNTTDCERIHYESDDDENRNNRYVWIQHLP